MISKIKLNITDYDKSSSRRLIYLEYPARIVESYRGELIILNDTFFEVFDKMGKFIKKLETKEKVQVIS